MYIRQRDVLVGAVLVLYIVFFALSPPVAVRSILSNPIGVAASFGVAIYTTLYYSQPIGALLIVALLASMTRSTEDFTVYSGTFNEATYLAANPDVKRNVESGKGFASGKAHWDAAGKNEGRSGSGLTVTQLVEGKSYKCSEGGPTIYLFKDGKLNPYPNTQVAGTWDTAWGSAAAIPCAGVPKGAVLAAKPGSAPPAPTPTPTVPATTPTPPTPSGPAAPRPPPATATPTPASTAKPVMACNIENFAPF